MANIRRILKPESIASALDSGWTIDQLDNVAQMVFDETYTGTHGPAIPFSSTEACIAHIRNHCETINGKEVRHLDERGIWNEFNAPRLMAHDIYNAQILRTEEGVLARREYYPEGTRSPYMVDVLYEAIWYDFPEEWKWSPDDSFDYKDLKVDIKDAVYNQLYSLIQALDTYMGITT